MTHLDFLNKNLYRKYPFQKTAIGSNEIDSRCVVALRVNQSYGQLNAFFFNIVSCVDGVFYANLVGVNTVGDEIPLGTFCDKVVGDGQVMKLRKFGSPAVAGTLTIGLTDAFTENFYAELDVTSGGVEPTCVGYFKTPLVTALIAHPRYNGGDPVLDLVTSERLYGDIVIQPSGITKSTASSTVSVAVVTPSQIMGKSEKSLCAGNCDLPVIYSIDGVTPDISGNINIVGVSPVVITTDGTTKTIGVTTPSIDRTLLCQGNKPNTPPVSTSNTYYTDVITALKAEWQTWSQYT